MSESTIPVDVILIQADLHYKNYIKPCGSINSFVFILLIFNCSFNLASSTVKMVMFRRLATSAQLRQFTYQPRAIPIQTSLFSTSRYHNAISDSLRQKAQQNNQLFKLSNLFNVKDKGMHILMPFVNRTSNKHSCPHIRRRHRHRPNGHTSTRSQRRKSLYHRSYRGEIESRG